MKKLLVALALFSLCCMPALAQDVPQFEVFGGYSLVYDEVETGHGFVGAVEGNVTEMFGIAGEFGYYNYDAGKMYTFMGGPRISYRAEKFRPFGHVLFGGVTASPDTGDSSTEFGMVFGGGLDIVLTEVISVRPVQFEALSVRYSDAGASEWCTDLRYSGGIVFIFGSK